MKNANLDKTIIFIDKKGKLEKDHKITKLQISKLSDDHKVIEYKEHKKMKSKEKKKQKILNSEFYKLRKKILIFSIVLLFVFVLFLLWNKYFEPSYKDFSENNFKVENQNLSNSDISTYSSIVKESVQKAINMKYAVNVDQIHKNGNLIFAEGYFNIPDKGHIGYDMILKNYSPYSLKINGEEYIKK